MKHIFLILIFSYLFCPATKAQILIDFEGNPAWEYEFHACNDSLWQIAVPSKGMFNGALSGAHALITDSANMVGPGKYAAFGFNVFNGGCFNLEINFYHKYNTDSLHSGGLLEVSYDHGVNWINVVYDTLMYDVWMGNFYSPADTTSEGYPAFMGSTDDWVYSNLWLSRHIICGTADSIMYRFVYVSDSMAAPAEGWMIDNTGIQIMPCSSGRKNDKNRFSITKEGENSWKITAENDAQVSVCSSDGKRMFDSAIVSGKSLLISTETWGKGIYFISVTDKAGRSSRMIATGGRNK